MERFQWFFNEAIRQFKNIEDLLKALMAKLPIIGAVAAEHSSLITIVFMIALTVFVLKPLVKWSIAIMILGTTIAGAVSYFTGMSFWGVLPLTALGAGIVMFTNRFIMG